MHIERQTNEGFRHWLGAAMLLLALGSTAARAVDFDRKVNFVIAAQPLSSALVDFSHQAQIQVMSSDLALGERAAAALNGRYSIRDALGVLLKGTNFSYSSAGPNTVAIMQMTGPAATTSSATNKADPQLRMARSEAGQSAGAGQGSATEGPEKAMQGDDVGEVIVTATKRAERLIDVPQSVTVLSADDLVKMGATQFRDFANGIPGLSFNSSGAGFNKISIRGVTAGNADIGPTVGIYVDDVPYGSTSSLDYSRLLALDVGLFDLDRVEVLKGPQGTLYGASSMGGLIRYVTKRPDSTRFGADAQAGISGTAYGGVSYNGAIAVNAPIVTDKLALRASTFYSHDGGFIDNVTLGSKDVDRADIYGGRFDFLFTPTAGLSVRLTGFAQNIDRDGESNANYSPTGVPLDDRLDQRRIMAEPFGQHFRLVSGTVVYDLGPATLTSISSYQTAKSSFMQEYPPLLSYLSGLAGPLSAVGILSAQSTEKFAQEVRLASNGARTLEWLIGGYYTHDNSGWDQQFVLRDLAGQPVANTYYTFLAPVPYEEYAAFGDLTWHLSARFDVTGGVRYASSRGESVQDSSGIFGTYTRTSRSSEDVFTYLANARYRFSDRATGYLRYATGYRPGGPNFVGNDPLTGLPIGPASFEADRLQSYEAGFKAETADRRFGLDVAGYFIDWQDIQMAVTLGGLGFRINADQGATVRGVEAKFSARPTRAFSFTSAFVYQDAHMSGANADLGAAKGERMPEVPRFSGALNANYLLSEGGLQPTIGAAVRYVGERMAGFDRGVSYPQYRLPEYTALDLRAGVTLDRVNLQLYLRNALDERGQLSAMPPQITLLQPRTVGLIATTQF